MATNTPAADADFDWSEITGRAVERLRAPRIEPVPEAIVKQAQRSYDGVPNPADPEKRLHVIEHEFITAEKAEQAAKLLKKAGVHTTPPTTVRVVIDPDGTGNLNLVRWKAGVRPGRKVS